MELGGDPESIRAVASWLREDLAGRLDRSVTEVRRVRDESAQVWCDLAGLSYGWRLNDGGRTSHRLLVQVERLAALLDECADGLGAAKELVAEAERLIGAHSLVVTDGWLFRPHGADPQNDPPHPSAPVDRSVIFEGRMEAYVRVETLMERAAQILLDLLDKLGRTGDEDWADLLFAAGDFVVDETAELAKWFRASALEDVERRAGWRADWLSQARRYDEGSWQSRFYRSQAQRQDWAALSARNAVETGRLTVRVLKVGGWLMTPVGLAYDIYTGEPPDKAVLVAGVSLAPALALAVVPVAGWLAVGLAAGAAALGYFSGQRVGHWYDGTQSARVKLQLAGQERSAP
jgi:hypothetical protein